MFLARFPTAATILLLAVSGCAVTPPSAPPLATKPTVGQEIGAVAQNKLEVTFPRGGSVLSADAQAQLDVAARLFRDVNPVAMFAIGYSDPVGNEFGNLLLSARRAEVVKQGLVARGIPADRVRLQAMGASDPPNTTQPDAPENRRVVVQWRVL